ncbi:hypothetical protein OBK28_07010 [Empedobacter falsenii]|uniref:Uncharacterized protein n=1 Tax=Empedobacter falsenii TaxID=343874 RepID=A0ABY8V6C6_9FLAO|nr:hypothetical protein [Empedobacter falsenii]WIH96702.1 hypothetical protein OBA43_10575 [Empedobacter falsenii]
MTKPTLKLPITLRFPEESEVPMNSSVLERLRESKNANIVPGYVFKLKDDNPENIDLAFEFYAEINVDNPKLWHLITALSKTLPEYCALIFGHSDFEINYGDYYNKLEILDFLKKYEIELTQDTFLNWGLIYHDENNLTEIFVDESKFLKYWGNDEKQFRKIMNDFDLNEIQNLEFIDEYPKVRENINLHFENISETGELIQTFKSKFIE